MTGTALEARKTLDLTRSPSEQWNAEMVEVVAKNLFRGREITQAQLHYCLTVADSLGLNPMINEIYFIPSKSRDGKGPAWQPYIGRNGLVKKATERAYYYESETVHANDKFTVRRKRDGTVEVTHSYGIEDRGEIVGAYAFLHDETGRRKPAFFLAKLSEYLPTFDAQWKMDASPWGNQRSAMIEKCAMIGAGRKRLDLGNVLADGEVARYQQMGEVGPPGAPAAEAQEFAFEGLTGDAVLAERLRLATSAAGWPAAKVEMVLTGLDDAELARMAEKIELEARPAETVASAAPGDAEGTSGVGVGEPVAGGDEGITEAHVVPDPSPEQLERLEALRKRLSGLEDDLNDPLLDEHQAAELSAEYDQVSAEIAAIENPDQSSLLG